MLAMEWKDAINHAKQQAETAGEIARRRLNHGEIVVRIAYDPKGAKRVRTEITETLPENR